jgi:hypothetical protein
MMYLGGAIGLGAACAIAIAAFYHFIRVEERLCRK